jgi:tetratricopeptide (TPR) repeat protein
LKAERDGAFKRSRNGSLLLAVSGIYSFEKGGWMAAGELISQALRENDYDARALSYKALHIITGAAQGWYDRRQEALADARYFSEKAVRTDRLNSIALSVRAHVMSFGSKDFESALSGFMAAEQANPACGITQAYKSLTLSYMHFTDESQRAIDKARDTLVYDPYWSFIDACEVVQKFFSGDFDSAVLLSDRVLAFRETFSNIVKIKVLSLSATGAVEDAIRTHRYLLTVEPSFSWVDHFNRYPFSDTTFREKIWHCLPREVLE